VNNGDRTRSLMSHANTDAKKRGDNGSIYLRKKFGAPKQSDGT
jgi:hypothetical protein